MVNHIGKIYQKEEDTFKRLQGTDFFATLPRFDSTEKIF